jgi:hypothetical protein
VTTRPVATALAGAVVIDARVAGLLAVMLRAAHREATRNGRVLPADLVEVLAVVESAAEVPAVPPLVPMLAPAGSAPAVSAAAPILLGVGEVARLVGLGERAVRKAAKRGRLAGRLVAGRWEFTPQAVTRWRTRDAADPGTQGRADAGDRGR